MVSKHVSLLEHLESGKGTRRGLTIFLASLPVTGSLGAWLDQHNAAAKKKHKKRKKTCGKNGGKPVKGKCCTNTVNVDGTCRTCDVCSSGCTFTTLQTAITAASPGATLAVCPGTYAGGLTIGKSLRLVGAGNSATVLQGPADASVVKTTAGTVTLQNLRLTGGGGDGAGLYIQAGTVSLVGSAISGNTGADGTYGVVYNAGSLQLTNSSVSNNKASIGGAFLNAGSLQLTNSVISGNRGQVGAGIYNLGGNVVFDNASRLTGNTADVNGGGIFNNGGTVTLVTSSNVSGNNPNNCAGMPAIALCSG